ncbi:MAG: hypothetical protein ACRDUY_07010 [Nitriliruptorales bacterium]
MPLLLLVILVLLAVWAIREFSHARRRQAFLATRDTRARPMPPPHQRVPDEELSARAAKLRRAVARGHITEDEAIGSLIRLGGSAVSYEQARQLLAGE